MSSDNMKNGSELFQSILERYKQRSGKNDIDADIHLGEILEIEAFKRTNTGRYFARKDEELHGNVERVEYIFRTTTPSGEYDPVMEDFKDENKAEDETEDVTHLFDDYTPDGLGYEFSLPYPVIYDKMTTFSKEKGLLVISMGIAHIQRYAVRKGKYTYNFHFCPSFMAPLNKLTLISTKPIIVKLSGFKLDDDTFGNMINHKINLMMGRNDEVGEVGEVDKIDSKVPNYVDDDVDDDVDYDVDYDADDKVKENTTHEVVDEVDTNKVVQIPKQLSPLLFWHSRSPGVSMYIASPHIDIPDWIKDEPIPTTTVVASLDHDWFSKENMDTF